MNKMVIKLTKLLNTLTITIENSTSNSHTNTDSAENTPTK